MTCIYVLINKHNLLLAYINFSTGEVSFSTGDTTADYREERGMQ
jgi:hypothetical protein